MKCDKCGIKFDDGYNSTKCIDCQIQEINPERKINIKMN